MKFIRVSWKNDDQIHAALQEETQKKFAMSDGTQERNRNTASIA
jgi:hypothetical protein